MISQTRAKKRKTSVMTKETMEKMFKEATNVNAKAELIQLLIPLGLQAVNDALQEEVKCLAGRRHSREGAASRWEEQPGSVYLGDEKFRIEVPRLRDTDKNREIPLESYAALQSPRCMDKGLLQKVLLGLSAGRYEETSRSIPEAFGLSKSTVSKRFIRASARKLSELMNRRLETEDILTVFVDGKSFAEDGIILAVGITLEGEKVILGFIQSASENERVIREFFEGLIERGLKGENGLLFVVDGSKGILKAIQTVFDGYALIQRCQWHKRENVLSYLPKSLQGEFKIKLTEAYHKSTYQEAKESLAKIKKELVLINQSASASLEEGLEETLTLHRLGLFDQLGTSFKTTNIIESIHARIGQHTDKVDYWKTSDQKHRWIAASLLDIEPRLRRVKGLKSLPLLRTAIKRELGLDQKQTRRIA
ncbi:MAG: transposase [Patescibacteria group bacterium]|nr:transposase [Patescibacteria group bacterium]